MTEAHPSSMSDRELEARIDAVETFHRNHFEDLTGNHLITLEERAERLYAEQYRRMTPLQRIAALAPVPLAKAS